MNRRDLLAGCAVLAPSLFFRSAFASATAAGTFTVEGDHFLLNGKPYQVIAGEMHYARIPREYWQHRIQMAKAMGLNTIATYVFWNVHEPKPGEYVFSGQYDLAAFIKAIQAEGLHVLLRAGPYSCAEWEFGGFPAWLLKDPDNGKTLRTNDPGFMEPAERWLKRLAQETAPLLIANGGPILAVQIENEYGNFSNDKKYMQHMLEIFQATGWKDSLLYTVDPSKALANGCIDGILSGVNFGTGNAEHGLAAEAALRPGGPLFATEYWPGWFDLFGHPHETRSVAPQLKDIEYVLSHGASINIYMFHGGTSFGMMAGASASTGNYRGNVTSYDYDAPLDEAGHTTPKYFAYRDLILKYSKAEKLPVPKVPDVVAIPEFTFDTTASFFVDLPKPIKSETLLTMEQADQAYGYVLYRTKLDAPASGELVLDPVHDFAQVYLDDQLVGTLDRHYNQTTLSLNHEGSATLGILVENTGRLNSTKNMRNEWKGLKSATLAGKSLTGWEVYPLPMDDAMRTALEKSWVDTRRRMTAAQARMTAAPPADSGKRTTPAISASVAGAHFGHGSFTLAKAGDGFLDVSQLGKGVLWINGRCLGRFWNIGPQMTLYVPGPWLKQGQNDVLVFDMFAPKSEARLMGRMKPILDGPTPTYADDPERKKKAAADAEFGPKLAAPAAPAPPPKE